MKLLVAFLIAMTSALSYAQTKVISVDAFDIAYSGGLAFTHKEGKKSADQDITTFRLNLNYAQNFDQFVGLMWKGQLHFNRQDVDYGKSDTLESAFGLAGGFVYNFQAEDIKNSVMASALIGLERATYEYAGMDDESGINVSLLLEAGKRWDMGHYAVANISYAPTISLLLKSYGGDIRDEYFKSSRDIRLNFLKFDVLF